MTILANYRGAIDLRCSKTRISTRTRRRKQQVALEGLESRTLLAYTFTFASPIATATGDASKDALVIEPVGGFLEHSVNGSPFSSDWSGSMVPASAAITVQISLSTGDGSSLVLGTPAGAASDLLAAVSVVAPLGNTSDTCTIDDSAGTTGGTYTIDTQPGTITGPGINFDQSASAAFVGGVTLKGSPVDGNVYDVLSILQPAISPAEPFTLMTAAGTASEVDVGNGGTLSIGSPLSIFDPGDATTLNINDQADTTHSTATLDLSGDPNAPFEVAGLSNSPIKYGVGVTAVNINGGTFGATGVTYDINNTQFGTTTTINGGPNQNFINLSNAGQTNGLDNLPGPVVVHGGTSLADVVTLDDSSADFNDNYVVTATTVTRDGPFGGLTYDDNIGTLTLNAENTLGTSGNNTIDINSTADFVITNVNGQGGVDTINVNDTGSFGVLNVSTGPDDGSTVNVLADNEPVNITGNAFATVNIGNLGSVAAILGAITIGNTVSWTSINVDASADTTDHSITLSGFDPTTIVGLAPATITYTTSEANVVTLDTGPAGNQVLNVDFSSGNPIPAFSATGLVFNAGADFGNVQNSHTMNIFGTLPSGPFDSETHNANDETVFPQIGQYGSIFFTDSMAVNTGLNYTGLLPINDTTPADTYTFNDFADDNSFSAFGAGKGAPVVDGFQTIQFVNTPLVPPPTFETTNIANKTNVIFNTNTAAGITGVVNIDTPSTLLANLTFNTLTDGDNTVRFTNTPPGVATSLNGGTDEDVTDVTGMGVAAGTVLSLNGGGSTNTLNYDAGGATPTITPGLLPGELLISIPGAGVVDAINYQQISIINTAPIVITPGPAVTINSVEGFRTVDAIVGTFTVPVPLVPPPPVGFSASDFTASIDWGDPSPDLSAGTITQDASNPSVYYISGTHTFVDTGTFRVDNTVAFAGGSITIPVNGVPISFTFGPSGPTPGTPATAVVTQGPLAVSAFPIVGTEGAVIPSGPIATFIDAGGADPVADYSATIDIFDATNALVVSVPAALITQNADSAQYTVVAPDITLPEAGTYQVQVLVTDDASPDPITTTGASVAVIADAALTAGAVTFTPTPPITGAPTVIAGAFTDANLGAPATDFSAVIDWGDGSPTSLGTITGTGGTYSVGGSHSYAKPGTYTATINVLDEDGATVTLTSPVTAVDPPLTVTSHDFRAVEGTDSGPVLLATVIDPNPLATVADLSATLTAWGDGTPGAPVSVPLFLVGHTAPGAPVSGIIFEVRAGHNYHDEGAFTFSLTVQTLGTGDAPVTVTGTANVADAALSSSNGTEITGIEGNSTGTVVLGTFHDSNPFATAADFTATLPIGGWGDGTPLAPVTLTITQIPTPPPAPGTTADTVFQITGSHTYAEAGTFAITINVTDVGGSTTVISDSAIIADALLTPAPAATQPAVITTEGGSGGEAGLYPVPVFGLPAFTGPVANFLDGNPTAPVTDFTATIDWGDGTPPTAGTVQPAPPGGTGFQVIGSHTYADAGSNGSDGHYTIQVFVTDVDGSRLTISTPTIPQAVVHDRPIVLTGQLDPSDDTGLSNNTPNVTSVTQPHFFGSAEPFSHVSLFATLTGGGLLVPIGTVQAGSEGFWDIGSQVKLADGTYTITATAVDQFGVTTTASPVTIVSNLVIDTAGPVITSVFFNRLNGEIDYVVKDPSPASGVNVASLEDSSNYLFTKVHPNKAFTGKYLVTNVIVTPGAAANSFDVAVKINSGRIIPGGFYLFTIRSSSEPGGHGVQDTAENLLDGEFFGTFPSGNRLNGTDFEAMLSGFHNKIFAPQTVLGTASPANGGNGGPPVGAVHSGNFVTVVPRGGGSVFGSDPKHLSGTAKAHHSVKGHSLVKHHAVSVKLHSATHSSRIILGKRTPKGPLKA
jgi:hypothetical protein